MLRDKVIIYDDSCPMCKLYTYWFVAWGFLRPENRIGFATAPAAITSHVDLDRGRHEIPLFDRSTHQTIYGLEALTYILASRWTWLNPVFRSRPFHWAFHPLYEIITYNRRVIAGCKSCCGFDCAPDLNRFYRGIYLVISICLIALAIGMFAASGSVFANAAIGLIGGFAGCGMILGVVKRITMGSLATWNFAGNQATTLLMVAAALTPLGLFSGIPQPLGWTCLATALLLGLTEMHRREN